MNQIHKSAYRFRIIAFFAMVIPVLAADGPVYDVTLSSRVRIERDGTGYDRDFRPAVTVAGRDLWDERLDFRISGDWELDLDRDDEIDRAYEGSWPRFREGYIDLHDWGAVDHLVLGRQYLSEVDYLHFDGVSLQLEQKAKVEPFVFAGRPISYFSSNSGEWLAGAGLRLRPHPTTEVQVDGYGIDEGAADNFAYALRLRQHFQNGFGDSLTIRWLDDELRDLRLRLSYQDPSYFDVTGGITWQAKRLGDDEDTRESRFFALFSEFMAPVEENVLASVQGNVYLGEHYILHAGAGHKYVLDRSAEGGTNFMNSDSGRINAGVTIIDLPVKGMTVDLSGRYARNSGESFHEFSGELGYQFRPDLHASIGATTARYNFADYLFFRDRFGLRIPDPAGGVQRSNLFFVETQYRPSRQWRISALAEYEDASDLDDDAFSLQLRVIYRFRIAGTRDEEEQEK